MIVGVGGQGSLLASKLLGNALMIKGFDVKVSEVHGMAQRGGSVVTYVRYGDEVASPVIEPGSADVIMSFELLEAARWLPYLKMGGKMIVNNQSIDPMPVITGAAAYPVDIAAKIAAMGVDIQTVDALRLAEEAGSSKAVNVVLMGVMAHSLAIEMDVWQQAIEQSVKPQFVELNKKAFALGYNA